MIAFTSRHLHTAVDLVEEWDIDKLIDYFEATKRVIALEAPRRKKGG